MGSTDLCEIFSPERAAAVCKGAGLVLGESMDIKSGYNVDLLADRNKCWESIIRDEPFCYWFPPVYNVLEAPRAEQAHVL